MTAAGVLLGLAAAAAGVALLRRAWALRRGGWRIALGWAALVAGTAGWRGAGAAWDKATALAVLAGGLVALATVALGADLPRARKTAAREGREIEPPAATGPAWRGWARAGCVGPLALATAVAVGACTALHGPGSEADRLVAAGFVLPLGWAAAGTWALTDDRLGRVAFTLAAVGVAAVLAART